MPLQILQYSSQSWSEHQSIASHTSFGGKACRRVRDRTLPHTVPPEVSPFKARNDTCFTAQIRIGSNVPLPAVKGALKCAVGGHFAGFALGVLDRAQTLRNDISTETWSFGVIETVFEYAYHVLNFERLLRITPIYGVGAECMHCEKLSTNKLY